MTEWIRICLFGYPHVEADGHHITLTPRVRSLLAYLVLHRERPVSRRVIAATLWPRCEASKARASLNTALWRLRQELEPSNPERGRYVRCLPNHEVQLNVSTRVRADVSEFEDAVSELRSGPRTIAVDEIGRLERCIEHGRSPLMEGNDEDWVAAERDRLRLMRTTALGWLAHHHERESNTDRAIGCLTSAVEADPLQEGLQRELMRLYAKVGRPARAVRQFEICRRALAVGLGMDPSERTIELFREVSAPTTARSMATRAEAEDPVGEALRELEQLRRLADETSARLRSLIPLVRAVADRGAAPAAGISNDGHTTPSSLGEAEAM